MNKLLSAQEISKHLIYDPERVAPYTVYEFHEIIRGVKSVRAIQELCQERHIAAVKLGNTWMIAAEWVNKFLAGDASCAL